MTAPRACTIGGERLHHYLSVSSFAEEVVVPESGAIPIEADAPLDVLALVGCAVATGVGAVLRTGAVPEGATVAVIGCGGVGLSVVQGARIARSGRVIAIDLDPARGELAQSSARPTRSRPPPATSSTRCYDLTGGGVDFAFDAIGKVETTEQAVRMLGIGGIAVVVGLPPSGARATFDPLALAEREQRIVGSNYGSAHPARGLPRARLALPGRRASAGRARQRPPPARGRRGRAAGPRRRPSAAQLLIPVALARSPVSRRHPQTPARPAGMLTRCLCGSYVGGGAVSGANGRMVPIGEASKALGVSVDTVRRWERSGRLGRSVTSATGG